jgi:hypothetical protein
MRRIKPRQSFEAYLNGQKLLNIGKDSNPEPMQEAVIEVNEQFRRLVEYTKQYRHYQRLYFTKTKKGEFAKDEQHFMMKYQEKIDNLLKQIQL